MIIATSPRGTIPRPTTKEFWLFMPSNLAGSPQPISLVNIAVTVNAHKKPALSNRCRSPNLEHWGQSLCQPACSLQPQVEPFLLQFDNLQVP